jgi:chemotaxis protein MotB
MRHQRRKHRDRVSHDRWLVSYADFITLLFAFFVVMYSTAQIDRKKVGELAAAIQVAFQQMGAFPPSVNPALPKSLPEAKVPSPPAVALSEPEINGSDASELRRELERILRQEIARHEVTIRNGPDGLVISLQEAGFFDSGSAGIRTRSLPALSRIANLLKQHHSRIRIEGHTDNVPIHNSQFRSNWELSTARSTEMIRLLITDYGLSPSLLSAAGYGEYHPIASNATVAGRAQNRRVDIVILRDTNRGPSAPQKPPMAPATSELSK